jgi:uncharacterized protein (TIGR03435 family)
LQYQALDETDLKGAYDFTLHWTPNSFSAYGPSLFAAFQEQLGLKLESRESPMEMLVVDQAEHLNGNE